MSYEKAMKHHRNIRKSKKQSSMHFGFDSCSTKKQSPLNRKIVCQIMEVERWFKERHNSERGKQHSRECIREAIGRLRVLYMEIERQAQLR